MRKALRETIALCAVALAPAALAVAFHPALADRRRAGLLPGEVRLDEVRDWHAETLWVDARPAEDFARDHIPGALPFDEARFDDSLGTLLAAWKPGMRIVVYCSSASCTTSRELARLLQEAGLSETRFLRGGWDAWLEARR
jgi:rhodanese-related sulfurtransferase